ncbi:Dolichyl-phosphate-mannose-protein mannosyltransferase-domain-containing protein [Catenaria anguillulae PL171]|uniref:Dolichyl-phosphate-mannose--protein mannosyltransferase n=1 Tax=Catenaria anguillulae PL171 TaxID=765915 RepID=A0A1Y2HY47_9FUNG|nr:Dolichyl-phosphate-mannose-protein mannosyltransferase-domain-containing protein [Catenaria anguillulae PL171]
MADSPVISNGAGADAAVRKRKRSKNHQDKHASAADKEAQQPLLSSDAEREKENKAMDATEKPKPQTIAAANKITPPSAAVTKSSAPTDYADSAWFTKLLFWLVTSLSFLTRVLFLVYPDQVVFDEVHFGKFASYYLRRTFYFDVHPPLGRLLIAGWGHLIGYSGHFDFKEIGDDYVKNKVPYTQLRFFPAMCGALVVPLVFEIMRELRFSPQACLLAAMLVVLDNALITQSRLILLDSMLMLFVTLALYCWVKFSKTRHAPFSLEWWGWLTASGVSLGLVMGVKMVGLFTVATVGIAVLVELWYLLDPKRTPDILDFVRHFAARAVCLIGLPMALYLTWFYIHFAVLTKTGPGDTFMSAAFQATLQGNKLSGESKVVVYGGNVTMRHEDTQAYLHSHPDRYPLEYEDGRISSQGQQVTAYVHSDVNNLWRIKPADPEKWAGVLDTTSAYVPVRDGDEVVLEHINTRTHLLTHDVASPMMPTNQEFTTIAEADWLKRYNETVFRIELAVPKKKDKKDQPAEPEMLKTLGVPFRFVHVKTGVAMYTHRKALPEWGFKQQEVNGNKKKKEKANRWFVEDVTGPAKDAAAQIEYPVDKSGEGLARPSFLAKFAEMQSLMISHNAGLTKPHPYQSPPHFWPVAWRGISFWQDGKDRQIYLLPNPLVYWIALAMMFIYLSWYIADVLSTRRGIPTDKHFTTQLHHSAGFLFLAWALHYFPFYLMGRSLFLHHYLPAGIISCMVAGAVYDFILQSALANMRRNTLQAAIGWVVTLVVVGAVAWSFYVFAPITYGNMSLTVPELKARKWLQSWDFQYSG